jgi:hypothetical protein
VIALNDSSEQAASSHLRLSELYRKEGKTAEAEKHLKRFREFQSAQPQN